MKGKIENLGKEAQKKAIKLSVEGLTHQAIADKLSEEFNTEITDINVQDFLKRKRNLTIQILKEDKTFQGKLVEQYFDTVQQIKNLNSELWKFFYELRKTPEYKDKIIICKRCKHRMILNIQSYGLLLKTADAILKQIEHVDRILGKLQKKSLNITYNYTDLSKKIAIALPTLLYEFEKKGIVKINKKRLKLYAGGKKMTFEEKEDEDEPDEEEEEIEVEEEL